MARPKENTEPQETLSTDIKPCFIITPIGELNSLINLKAKGLINSVIEPVLTEFGFYALPAYKMADSGSINRQVLKSIIANELVIANLTGLNPNVMYELAVRHAVRLPVIIMAEDDTKLPFDINDQRTIFYSDTLLGSEIAKPALRSAIEAVLKSKDEPVDNPIYQVYEELSVIKSTKGKEQTVDEYLLNRFDRLENAINRITHSPIPINTPTEDPRRLKDILIKIKQDISIDHAVKELQAAFARKKVTIINLKLKGDYWVHMVINTPYSPNYIKALAEDLNVFSEVDVAHVL